MDMPGLVCTCQLRAQTWGFLETSSQLKCRGPCSEWSLVLHTPASHRRSTSSFQTRSSWRSQSRPEEKNDFVPSVRQSWYKDLYQITFILLYNEGEAGNCVIISLLQAWLQAWWTERFEQLVVALPKATNWFLHEERREWWYPKKHRTGP